MHKYRGESNVIENTPLIDIYRIRIEVITWLSLKIL